MQLRKNWKKASSRSFCKCSSSAWCNSERIESIRSGCIANDKVFLDATQKELKDWSSSWTLPGWACYDATQKELKVKDAVIFDGHGQERCNSERIESRRSFHSWISAVPTAWCNSERIESRPPRAREEEAHKVRCTSERIESFSSKPRRPLVVYDFWDSTQKESKEYVSKLFLFPEKGESGRVERERLDFLHFRYKVFSIHGG